MKKNAVAADNPFDINKLNRIKQAFVKRGETIAVAESVTAGLLQLALASAQDAMQYFQGGITTYNLGQKSRHLNIDPIHCITSNCVSERIACDMALNVCRFFNSQWGMGITGYASPVPQSGNKIFCYYAIAHNAKVIAKGHLRPDKDEPFRVQVAYVNQLLNALLKKTALAD